MAGMSVELQKAVYSVLTGDATLSALITGVYDWVPENVAFPYVTIGETDIEDVSPAGKTGQRFTLNVHAWSRYRGTKEVKDILWEVHRLLHRASLSVSGYTVAGIQHQGSLIMLDPDGETRHGIARYRCWLYEV